MGGLSRFWLRWALRRSILLLFFKEELSPRREEVTQGVWLENWERFEGRETG